MPDFKIYPATIDSPTLSAYFDDFEQSTGKTIDDDTKIIITDKVIYIIDA